MAPLPSSTVRALAANPREATARTPAGKRTEGRVVGPDPRSAAASGPESVSGRTRRGARRGVCLRAAGNVRSAPVSETPGGDRGHRPGRDRGPPAGIEVTGRGGTGDRRMRRGRSGRQGCPGPDAAQSSIGVHADAARGRGHRYPRIRGAAVHSRFRFGPRGRRPGFGRKPRPAGPVRDRVAGVGTGTVSRRLPDPAAFGVRNASGSRTRVGSLRRPANAPSPS